MEVLTLSRSNIWRMVWDVSIKSVRFRHSDLEKVVREGHVSAMKTQWFPALMGVKDCVL